MKHKKSLGAKKNTSLGMFAPNSEKIFVASIPLLPIIPIVLYAVSNFLIGHESLIGKSFYFTGFISYAFISLFAIPFEGILEIIGRMSYGGGIFEVGIKGLDFLGIVIVQIVYAAIFYLIFSITSHFRTSRRMGYSYGKRG